MSAEPKVVVITGASQGIGAGLVEGFLGRGYRVVANSRKIEPSVSPDVLSIAGDVADPETAGRIIGAAIDRFGRIDTLVNNAGVFLSKPYSIASDRVTASSPPLVRAASAAGTAAIGWSTRLVVMLTI
jgi:NAD(P)-dependent dehydrogenase (short-subunit alcohol dehydrogenase family)